MHLPTRPLALLLVCASPALLGGCLAKTAFDVATAPVRVVGKTVDLMTTSQSEADEKAGRALRRYDEELSRLERRQEKATSRCNDGDEDGCEDSRDIAAEMERLNRRQQ